MEDNNMENKNVKYSGNTTKPGNPLWNEFTDNMGNSSLSVHTPRKIWQACRKECFYIQTDSNGTLQCKRCGHGTKIVWGMQKLVNGKIVKINIQ